MEASEKAAVLAIIPFDNSGPVSSTRKLQQTRRHGDWEIYGWSRIVYYNTYHFLVHYSDNHDELYPKAKKYLRGDGVNLEILKDKKLKGQLHVKEKLYGQSVKAAAMAEKLPAKGHRSSLKGSSLEFVPGRGQVKQTREMEVP